MITALIVALLAVQDAKPVGHLALAALGESSGICSSARYPGVYWTINDSGNPPALFAIKPDGASVMPSWLKGNDAAKYAGISLLGASNVDWEDIVREGDNLIVCETGNNGNARRDLGFYVLPEPNPLEIDSARPTAFIPVAYEDQKEFPPKAGLRFDCEAAFTWKGRLYVITKHRRTAVFPDVSANLYRLDTRETSKVNPLKRVDSAADLGGWVTAACMSTDGKTLAVLCQAPAASIWLFETPKQGDRFFQSPSRRIKLSGVRQAEAVCWEDATHLLITNEQRDVFRVGVGP